MNKSIWYNLKHQEDKKMLIKIIFEKERIIVEGEGSMLLNFGTENNMILHLQAIHV